MVVSRLTAVLDVGYLLLTVAKSAVLSHVCCRRCRYGAMLKGADLAGTTADMGQSIRRYFQHGAGLCNLAWSRDNLVLYIRLWALKGAAA